MRPTFSTHKPYLQTSDMLWLSWPKAGRLSSDLGLPIVIKIDYDFGPVESTCLGVNDVWAGLKFTHARQDKVYENS